MMKSRKTRALAVRILIADKGISLQRRLVKLQNCLSKPLKKSSRSSSITTLQLPVSIHQDDDDLKLSLLETVVS
ncbi:MAG: hypothetical protein ACHBN1_00710 [Heteroscytonema crispum UTEX LB 1556]